MAGHSAALVITSFVAFWLLPFPFHFACEINFDFNFNFLVLFTQTAIHPWTHWAATPCRFAFRRLVLLEFCLALLAWLVNKNKYTSAICNFQPMYRYATEVTTIGRGNNSKIELPLVKLPHYSMVWCANTIVVVVAFRLCAHCCCH